MKNFIYFILFVALCPSLSAQGQWMATNSRDTFDNLALHSKGDTLFASIGGVGTYITTDNGNNWFKKNNGLPNTFVVAFASNQQYIFAGTSIGSDGGIFRSANNGENWEKVINGLSNVSITNLVFKGDTLFASTGRGIFYTLNNGMVWNKSNTPSVDNIDALYAQDSLILGFYRSDLFRSADNGVTWENIRLNTRSMAIKVVKTRNGLLLATSASGLYRSNDGGKTWNAFATPNIGNIGNMISHDTLLFIVENYQGVFKSIDDGQTWTKFGEGLPSTLYRGLAIHNNLLFVLTDGKKIWRRALNETNSVQKVAPSVLQINLYPNPVTQNITLKYQLDKKSDVVINVSDVNGRVVKHFYNNIQVAGKQEINFPVYDLKPGTYFCTLKVDRQIAAVPFQIIR